jgi:hypothetical protein
VGDVEQADREAARSRLGGELGELSDQSFLDRSDVSFEHGDSVQGR